MSITLLLLKGLRLQLFYGDRSAAVKAGFNRETRDQILRLASFLTPW